MPTFIKNADFVNCVDGDGAAIEHSNLFLSVLCWKMIIVEGRLKKHI